MVTLTTAAFLSALGIVVWVVGLYMDYPGISMIGAVVFLGVGAMMVGGQPLEYQAGKNVTSVALNNSSCCSSVLVTEYTYQEVPTPINWPLGMVLMLLAGVMALQSLDKFSENQ